LALIFEWDARKDRANQRKHGVSFMKAQTVFLDDSALFLADPDHSDAEDRFLLLGLSTRIRALVVCHCYRGSDDLIRIVSASTAARQEREVYASREKSG